MFPLNFLRMFKRPPGKKPPPKNFVDLFWDADNARLVVQFDDGTTAPVSDEGGGGGGSVDWAVVTAATGTNPATGSGRFRFNLGVSGLATRNALGVGAVDLQTYWDASSQVASGVFSFAAGVSNSSSGVGTLTLGTSNAASGTAGTAIGAGNIADSGVAVGFNNTVTSGFALGNDNTLTSGGVALGGNNSITVGSGTILGDDCEVSALFGCAIGLGCTASGVSAFAFGRASVASASYATAGGFSAEALHSGSRVYAGGSGAGHVSTVANEFTCNYTGGYRMTGGAFQILVTTVAGLPAASTHTYYEAWVSNANSPTVGATVAGGGSAKAKVASNGTNWIVTAVI